MKKGARKHGDRFRLNRPASGMVLRNGKEVSIPIPEGTVIEIVGGPFNGTQLMDVRCNDEMVLMSRIDLERGLRAKANPVILDRPKARRQTLRLKTAAIGIDAVDDKDWPFARHLHRGNRSDEPSRRTPATA